MKSWTLRSADYSIRTALIALCTLVLTACATAPSGPPPLVSAVIVDVSALRDRGLGSYADRVAVAVLSGTVGQYQVEPQSGAPRIILRINEIKLSAFDNGAETQGFTKFGGMASTSFANQDYIGGTAALVSGSTAIATTTILANLQADTAAWYQPDNEKRRLEALGAAYAQWARRRLFP